MPAEYAPQQIEAKWQAFWEREKTFRTPNPGDPGFDATKRKFYVLDMFPYPSGSGLHVGHPEGYTATDIIARYKRMKGFNVLHPMGWDAFGLPAEQHAVETGTHPAVTTKRNIDTFRRQLKMLGFSYDWDRELSTTDEAYYRWTQWIFLKLFNGWYDDECQKARPIAELSIPADVKSRGERAVREFVDSHRLAYLAEVPVNWCPALGTVLANEEVTNEGRSERGNHPVYRRPMRQWMLRITKYADRLERDLEELAWPESVKLMQRNWIGRSEGAFVRFGVDGGADAIEIFTTRPDTLFGATYMVLAPEHPLVEKITTDEQRVAVAAYCQAAAQHTDLDRTAEAKKKTGVFTGAYAINPVWPRGDKRARIPVWVADYVLMGYGTGAIMAVPGSDDRDYQFAKQFALPIRDVVYHRFIDAVGHFARRARGNKDLENRWPTMMADYLGLIFRNDQTTFDEAFEIVQRDHARGLGGHSDGTATPALREALNRKLNSISDPSGGIVGRGAVSDAWRTVVAQLETLNLTELDAAISRGTLYDRLGLAYSSEGHAVNSPPADLKNADVCDINGLPVEDGKKKIIAWLSARGVGRAMVTYKLRDWLFSRQRYWGEPFPILHGPDGEIVALDESELPLKLPEVANFAPTEMVDDSRDEPEPPLGRAKEWATVIRGGKTYCRELNTMPQWAGSCWYYLRFLDPKNDLRLCGEPAERYWMLSKRMDGTPHIGGIDLYLGGAEHAVLHLLYARFWHKVLFDLGYVSTIEPFGKLFNQGMIRAFAYTDSRGAYIGYDDINFREDGAVLKTSGETLRGAVEKMSKSMKNVINPEEVVREYGADSLRLYEMFMGPLDASKPWNPRDVPGVFRFLQRAWRMLVDERTNALSSWVVDDADGDIEKSLHKTIKKVGEDIDKMAFNTAISAMMEFVNEVYRAKRISQKQARRFALILAPFAPHLAEELWQRLHGDAWKSSLAYETWPAYDEKFTTENEVEIPVQVNGKVVARISVARDAEESVVKAAAMAADKVKERVGTGQIAKVIYVPGRMLNLVAKS